MVLGSPKYRPSRFRPGGLPTADPDRYLIDDALGDDPRTRQISALEQALVRSHIDALPDGAVVADVPCGNGRMVQWVTARPGLKLVAMDYSLEMLQAMSARGLEPAYPRRVCADITWLPLPDQSVDLLINMRLMHHIPQRDTQVAMYRQIARVTRGLVITSFWTTHSWRYIRRRVLGKSIRGFPVSPSHFQGVCREAGLAVKSMVPVRRWYEEQVLVVCEALR